MHIHLIVCVSVPSTGSRPQHLWSTYCSSLTHERAVLIGDAAHSMWASLGQGVNSALGEQNVACLSVSESGACK